MIINNEVGAAIARAANGILYMWRELHLEAEKLNDCWHRHERRQALQDAVACMKTNGLIEDYDMLKCEVKINGQWSSASCTTIV